MPAAGSGAERSTRYVPCSASFGVSLAGGSSVDPFCPGTANQREGVGERARLGVPAGSQTDRQRPGDREVWVVVGDRDILGRVVPAIDAVGHICRLGERLEPMRTSRRNVERTLTVTRQGEA